METNHESTPGPTGIQVFELTMDNDEDQDELNGRLRKSGAPQRSDSVKPATPAISPPADTEAAGE